MFTDPVAYFITWTCYGTWLPGDHRGWTKWHKGEMLPQPFLAEWCRGRMKESSVVLDGDQRKVVEDTVTQHCQLRGWQLHAVNCRSNHCHVVVTAKAHNGKLVRDQLKAWCSRKLKQHFRSERCPQAALRERLWTGGGSIRLIFDEDSLAAAITYTLEAQDAGGSNAVTIQAEGNKSSGSE